ncbi:MAG: two-component system response regulator [Magnetococcus sp. WYHC-3]
MSDSLTKPIILIVDDTPENLDVLGGVLARQYKVKAALNGPRALKIARSDPRPDMILLDVMMPEMDGYEVCRQLKADPLTASIPVIFVTAKTSVEDERKGLTMGAVDYLAKPISPPIVELRVQTQLALYDQRRQLEAMVRERTHELLETRLEVIRRLGRAAEFRDNETGLHVIRMSHYTRLLAEAMNLSQDWVTLIFNAAPMHDIGKIGIPDNVLLKPGKLDEQEWQIMRKHAEYGAQIIGEHHSELMKLSREIALSHHEKWDGSGYPLGIRGADIPLSGRIVAIADVFDALTSHRPYKKAWTVERAMEVILQDSGTHFDPELTPLFRTILPEVLEIKEKYAEDPHFSLEKSAG